MKYIRDFKLWKDVLYLLISADIKPRLPRGAPEPFEKADQVYVLAFEVSGKFLQENPIRGVPADPYAPALFAAGGIALYTPDLTSLSPALHLAYSGTAYAGQARAEYARYAVDSTGTLSEIVAPTAVDPAGLCGAPTDCEFRAIGLGGRPSPDQPPRIYLGGWLKPAGDTADFLAVQVDADGVPAPSFGSGGATIVDFPASPLPEEFGRLLTVVAGSGKAEPETIYLAGEINGTCARGAGIVKLSADGSVDPLFGVDGRGRWFSPDASSPDGPECLGSGNLIRLRGGVVLDGDRLVFAGLRERGVTWPATGVESDALLTSIDRRSGEVKAKGLVSYEAGARTRDSGLTDLITTRQGAYIATGSIRVPLWSIPAGTSQVATVALKMN
ncbi:MAG: hypothetical protein JNN30_16130 [Rhodanobacteraceae bacterium]|nr:hypothetical protein [Rhodanobacteraceae bacterium]